jgi:hypothetical protein
MVNVSKEHKHRDKKDKTTDELLTELFNKLGKDEEEEDEANTNVD